MALRAFLASLAIGALIVTTAEAGPPTSTLQATFAQANRIIADPTMEDRPLDRIIAIRALFAKVFDFRGAAEQVLGPEWKARTAVEQREFTSIFSGFVQRGFVYWLASVAEVDDGSGGITVRYLREAVERDRAVVRTAIGRRGGREVVVDNDMIYLDKRWMLRDVTVDGISLVTNYRAQFDRVIRGSSYRELVARLRVKTGSELPRPASAGPEALGADLVKSPPPPFEVPFEMR